MRVRDYDPQNNDTEFFWTRYREREPIIYDGDLMDEENVLDFLTSLEAMDLPDRIEEVNAKILAKIIEDTEYVAVLFCKYILELFTAYTISSSCDMDIAFEMITSFYVSCLDDTTI